MPRKTKTQKLADRLEIVSSSTWSQDSLETLGITIDAIFAVAVNGKGYSDGETPVEYIFAEEIQNKVRVLLEEMLGTQFGSQVRCKSCAVDLTCIRRQSKDKSFAL